MPHLTVDTSVSPARSPRPAHPASNATDSPMPSSSWRDESTADTRRPASPDRPPVSPLTPVRTLSHADEPTTTAPASTRAAPVAPNHGRRTTTHKPSSRPTATSQPQARSHHPPPTYIPHPPPVPLDQSDNPDVVALRATISLLQLQRDKSRRDLRALEELKRAAVAEPEAFAKELVEGRLRGAGGGAGAARGGGDALGPTLAGSVAGMAAEVAGGLEKEDAGVVDALATEPRDDKDGDSDDDDEADREESRSRFPAIPAPQNIFRLPPINWAKYGVVGEPLDRLAQEAAERPLAVASPAAALGGAGLGPDGRPPRHVVAAPYSPFTDGHSAGPSHGMQTRRRGSKPGL